MKDYIEISEDYGKSKNDENRTNFREENHERKIEYDYTKINSKPKKLNFEETEAENKKIKKTDIREEYTKKNNSKYEDETENEKKEGGKWIIILTLIILIYFLYQPLSQLFIETLKDNPTFYKHYMNIFSEINNSTLFGLFIISILGSLFFVMMPSEAIFLYYVSSTYYNSFTIIFIVVFGTVIGFTFNYLLGLLLGEKILRKIFKKDFDKYKKLIDNWGGWFIFLGNIIPGPIEILSLFFGGFKYNYKKFIILTALGRAIKYLLLFIAFFFFWDQLLAYYDSFMGLL